MDPCMQLSIPKILKFEVPDMHTCVSVVRKNVAHASRNPIWDLSCPVNKRHQPISTILAFMNLLLHRTRWPVFTYAFIRNIAIVLYSWAPSHATCQWVEMRVGSGANKFLLTEQILYGDGNSSIHCNTFRAKSGFKLVECLCVPLQPYRLAVLGGKTFSSSRGTWQRYWEK